MAEVTRIVSQGRNPVVVSNRIRIAPQVTEILHRHKCPDEELVFHLIIADCHRNIMLEFALVNDKQRKLSLDKIDRLAKVVNEFRDAVHAEAKLIDKQAK